MCEWGMGAGRRLGLCGGCRGGIGIREPCLARESAFSFPVCPTWALIQCRVIL